MLFRMLTPTNKENCSKTQRAISKEPRHGSCRTSSLEEVCPFSSLDPRFIIQKMRKLNYMISSWWLEPDPVSWRNRVSCSFGCHLLCQVHNAVQEEMPFECWEKECQS